MLDVEENGISLCLFTCFALIHSGPLVFALGCAEVKTFSPELSSYSFLVVFSAEYVDVLCTTMEGHQRLTVFIHNF